MGSQPAFPTLPRNQGWNNGIRWKDSIWPEQPQPGGCKYHDRARDRYIPPHDRVKATNPVVTSENLSIEYMLTQILNKVEASDKVLKEMKSDFSQLNQTVSSQSTSINVTTRT